VTLEHLGDVTSVRCCVAHDRGGAPGAQFGATAEARLREIAEQAAAGQAPASRLGIEVREQFVGEGHHDLGHRLSSIPGIAIRVVAAVNMHRH